MSNDITNLGRLSPINNRSRCFQSAPVAWVMPSYSSSFCNIQYQHPVVVCTNKSISNLNISLWFLKLCFLECVRQLLIFCLICWREEICNDSDLPYGDIFVFSN